MLLQPGLGATILQSKKRKKKAIIIFLGLLCFSLILFLLTSLCLFGYYVSPHSVTGSFIKKGSGVFELIRSDGFNTLFIKDVIISSNASNSGTSPINCSFYKALCNNIPKTCYSITENVSCSNSSGCNIREGGLFSGIGDKPVLTYTSKVDSTLTKTCAFQLYLFNDKNKYNALIQNNTLTGYVKKSNCLAGIISNATTVTTSFSLNNSVFYYVALMIFDENLTKVQVTLNINSYICNHSVELVQREPCLISKNVRKCTISVSDGIATKQGQMCILTYSNANCKDPLNYSTTTTGFSNIASIVSFIFGGIFLFLFSVTVVIGLIYFKYYRKFAKRYSNIVPINDPYLYNSLDT